MTPTQNKLESNKYYFLIYSWSSRKNREFIINTLNTLWQTGQGDARCRTATEFYIDAYVIMDSDNKLGGKKIEVPIENPSNRQAFLLSQDEIHIFDILV